MKSLENEVQTFPLGSLWPSDPRVIWLCLKNAFEIAVAKP